MSKRPRKFDPRTQDDESGFVWGRSKTTKRWDGAIVHSRNTESRNPQEFVRAKRDPKPLDDPRPRAPSADYCPNLFTVLPNGTVLYHTTGPYAHLIPDRIAASADDPKGMKIGCFTVYPD